MLGTVLLPVVKMTTGYRHAKHAGCRQNDDTYNKSNQRLKNRIGEEVFKGIPKDERIELQARGLLRNKDVL